jgi:hypothetical protein
VRHDEEISGRRPSRDERAGAGGQGLSLISQHHDIAECRLGFDRPKVQQFRRVGASAPRRAQDFFERDPFPLEPRSDFLCVRPPLFAEVALRGAIIDAESRRIASTTRRIGMAHQGDVAACPQRLPGIGRVVSAGDLRRAAEAEKEREDDEAHAAHGGLHQKYAIRRPAQIAPSHSASEISAVALAPPGASSCQLLT